jgi:hypothetical protein
MWTPASGARPRAPSGDDVADLIDETREMTPMHAVFKPHVLLAIAGGLALAIAGCDKDGEAGDQPTAAATGSPSAEAQAVAALGDPTVEDPGGGSEGGGETPDGPTPQLDRDTYVVRVSAPASTSQGEGGVAEIHVVPKEGWKMNHDFPMRLVVESPEGVTVEGSEQEIADAVHYSDERGEWAVRFTPEVEGEKTFEADFRFAVCTDEVCIPKRETLAWVVDVE